MNKKIKNILLASTLMSIFTNLQAEAIDTVNKGSEMLPDQQILVDRYDDGSHQSIDLLRRKVNEMINEIDRISDKIIFTEESIEKRKILIQLLQDLQHAYLIDENKHEAEIWSFNLNARQAELSAIRAKMILDQENSNYIESLSYALKANNYRRTAASIADNLGWVNAAEKQREYANWPKELAKQALYRLINSKFTNFYNMAVHLAYDLPNKGYDMAASLNEFVRIASNLPTTLYTNVFGVAQAGYDVMSRTYDMTADLPYDLLNKSYDMAADLNDLVDVVDVSNAVSSVAQAGYDVISGTYNMADAAHMVPVVVKNAAGMTYLMGLKGYDMAIDAATGAYNIAADLNDLADVVSSAATLGYDGMKISVEKLQSILKQIEIEDNDSIYQILLSKLRGVTKFQQDFLAKLHSQEFKILIENELAEIENEVTKVYGVDINPKDLLNDELLRRLEIAIYTWNRNTKITTIGEHEEFKATAFSNWVHGVLTEMFIQALDEQPGVYHTHDITLIAQELILNHLKNIINFN